MSTQMKVNEFESTLHMPKKLNQIIKNGKEIPQMLPPRNARSAYPVDSYPACPDSWMNGSDIAGSYFVGVEEDEGMWLDFNKCCDLDRDVAVVISVQGVNPITGKKTDTLRLEQYKKKCPIHDIDFQQDNYCPDCDFDWPDQNYLSTAGTPLGNLWLDGFRRPDGTVRQYIFTAEEMKGIASQLIGKDKVYAIGIAFYYSKDKKPKKAEPISYRGSNELVINYWHQDSTALYGTSCCSMNDEIDYEQEVDLCLGEDELSRGMTCQSIGSASMGPSASMGELTAGNIKHEMVQKCSSKSKGIILRDQASKSDIKRDIMRAKASKPKTVKPVKKLEIGAGALINQKVYRDPKDMDYWEDKPAGMMYINYCDMETCRNIIEAGEIKKKSEGFMDGLKVGS